MDPKRRAKDIKGAPHDVPGVFSTLNGKNLKPNKWAIKSTLVDWLIYNIYIIYILYIYIIYIYIIYIIYIVNIGTYILIY